ncbi:MAG: hypothetical protein V4558_05680 [Gemmatimonadota bacterium]
MAQIMFDNPNAPEQPAKGVYRWFYRHADGEVTIYVGCAGNRAKTVGAPSTLKRGVQEAQRSCVSSDKGKRLDTDFVVGTALHYLKQQGHDCIWQHISDNPTEERSICRKLNPLLQSGASNIHSHLRLMKPGGATWAGTDVLLAEQHLLDALRAHFGAIPGARPAV